MELYARVRRAIIVEQMSEREAARQFGLARETVQKMPRYAVPRVISDSSRRVGRSWTPGLAPSTDYVRLRKLSQREIFVPLEHPPGDAQADFGEAMAVIAGAERKAHYLVVDLPQSDDCFEMAFPAETTGAFLEGHNHAFAYFGAVPRTIVYSGAHSGRRDADENAGVQRTAEPLSVHGEVRTSRQGKQQGEKWRDWWAMRGGIQEFGQLRLPGHHILK